MIVILVDKLPPSATKGSGFSAFSAVQCHNILVSRNTVARN